MGSDIFVFLCCPFLLQRIFSSGSDRKLIDFRFSVLHHSLIASLEAIEFHQFLLLTEFFSSCLRGRGAEGSYNTFTFWKKWKSLSSDPKNTKNKLFLCTWTTYNCSLHLLRNALFTNV